VVVAVTEGDQWAVEGKLVTGRLAQQTSLPQGSTSEFGYLLSACQTVEGPVEDARRKRQTLARCAAEHVLRDSVQMRTESRRKGVAGPTEPE